MYEKFFDLIPSDVWIAPCLSRDNHKYSVTFIDEKSKYTWLTLIPSKDRVLDAFKNFHSCVTNHCHAKLKILRSDNGGEYTSQAFKKHLASTWDSTSNELSIHTSAEWCGQEEEAPNGGRSVYDVSS